MTIENGSNNTEVGNVLESMDRGTSLRFKNIMLSRIKKELIIKQPNEHGGDQLQGTVEEPIDGFKPIIRIGHNKGRLNSEGERIPDTFYIQVFPDATLFEPNIELFIGGDMHCKYHSPDAAFPDYLRWCDTIYSDLSANEDLQTDEADNDF